MRRNLRLVAAVVAVLAVVLWFALGANRGWTRTTSTRFALDPTADNMVIPVIENDFSPGVELLATGLVASAALAGISFAFKPKPNQRYLKP